MVNGWEIARNSAAKIFLDEEVRSFIGLEHSFLKRQRCKHDSILVGVSYCSKALQMDTLTWDGCEVIVITCLVLTTVFLVHGLHSYCNIWMLQLVAKLRHSSKKAL